MKAPATPQRKLHRSTQFRAFIIVNLVSETGAMKAQQSKRRP
jgi:hypothetical protein